MKVLGRSLQTDEQQPAPPATRDNLYEPREDGAIDGHQDYYVRRTSLLFEAQKRPVLSFLAAAAAAGLGVLLLQRKRRSS